MHGKTTFKAVVFGILLLVANSKANPDTADSFDFIFSTEFKDAEVVRLLALPPEAVSLMSNRLENMDDGDPNRHRLVSSLIRKLKQVDLDLPLEIRQKAITALKGKFSTVNQEKQDLIRMVESDPSGIKNQPSGDRTEKEHLDVNSSEGQISTQLDYSNRSPSMDLLIWPWMAGLGALVIALRAVIKRRS